MTDNPKGELIARLSAEGRPPEFRVEESGPPHAPSFHAQVWSGGEVLGHGRGSSKREAERLAAEEALGRQSPDTGIGAVMPASWPIYPGVLAEALAVADERAALDAPLPQVAADAAGLYRELLAQLGHQPGSEPEKQ